jgi:branched-chain amino acid transport system substrate-binding protein
MVMQQQAVVILKIGEGSLEQGFPFTLRVSHPDRLKQVTWDGKLPAAPAVNASFQHWTGVYGSLGQGTLIRIPTVQVTNVDRVDDCLAAADALAAAMNDWLMERLVVQTLVMPLLQALPQAKGLKFFVQTDDPVLLRLPWQVWQLFEQSYPDAEVMLSSDFKPNAGRLRLPVKVLAIEGDTSGTAAHLDVSAIATIPGMQLKLLQQPTQQDLVDQLWHASWDLLLFMGHSRSQAKTGEISLNSTETLSLDDLHDALQFAVNNGLKMALFNSCDGVGIAAKLADLKIPYTIVMRQPIPDVIAQMFLQTFLISFSRGKSVNQSVHAARRKLKESKTRLPYASWLPVIYQNPAAPELRYPRSGTFTRWWKYGVMLLMTAVTIVLASLLWNKSAMPPAAIVDSSLQQQIKHQALYEARSSFGTQLLGNYSAGEREQLGSAFKAFQAGRYLEAQQGFDAFRATHEYPEIQIYANNAKIRQAASQPLNQSLSSQSPSSQSPIGQSPIGQSPIAALGTIVASVPFHGNSPVTAEEMLRGIAQAQSEALDQGRTIEVMILADGNGRDAQGQTIMPQLANQVVANPQIKGVIGPNASDAARDAADVYDRHNLLMVTPTAFFDAFVGLGSSVYRMLPQRREFIQPLATAVRQGRYGDGMVAVCADRRSRDNRDIGIAFEKLLKSRAVTIESCISDRDVPKTEREIITMLRGLKRRNIDTLLLAPHIEYLPEAFHVAEIAQDLNFQLLGTATFYNNRIISDPELARKLDGMEVYVPWFPPKATQAGKNPFTLQWNQHVTWRTAMSYDVFRIMAQGLAQEAAQNRLKQRAATTTRQGLQGFFETANHPGVSGRVQFIKGDRINDLPYGEILKITQNAAGGWQYIPTTEEIAPRSAN